MSLRPKKQKPEPSIWFRFGKSAVLFAGDGVYDFEVFNVVVEVGAGSGTGQASFETGPF